ncbi:lipopolysaccharide biosynthesis protein [Streptomyces niveus]|uniref:Lipopolysaccharide biosynthesis protein n=1 Tax=Streptomyces niveus TaxID=193462 RepID=A0ABZ2AB60_STRNV|nr:lipopolysaccharide biosynthesis protein [Streptomyces niveus]WTA59548.1 lipopolysaccharide biosynthesis protein [Streptomyces niveus]
MTENESGPAPADARPRRFLSRIRPLPVWWIVPVGVLIGALAGGAYGMLRTPQYSATSYVLVVPTDKTDPAAALGFAQAYGRVASQVAAVGDAQIWAGVSSKVLKENVTTVTSPDAPMISVTAKSSAPQMAVSMADGVARSLVLNGTQMQGSTNVRVVQFSRAVKPTSPVSPSAPLAALVGGAAGGLLGGLGLLVRPKRRTTEVRHAPVPGPSTAATPATSPSTATAPVPQTESV